MKLGTTIWASLAFVAGSASSAEGNDSKFNLQDFLNNPDNYSLELYSDQQVSESRKRMLDCINSIIESGSNNFAPCILPDTEVHITKEGWICTQSLSPKVGFSKSAEQQEEEKKNYTPIPKDIFEGLIS